MTLADPIRIHHPGRADPEPEPKPVAAPEPEPEPDDKKKPINDPKRLQAFFGGLH